MAATPGNQLTGLQRSDVFVLGAGFSKAISPLMPSMNELGHELLNVLRCDRELRRELVPYETQQVESGKVPYGDIEAWFSALAVPQPFHSDVEALRRRALFLQLSEVLLGVVERQQREAERQTKRPPEWLARLVDIWHRGRLEVITFNYDTLVENAAWTLDPMGNGQSRSRPFDLSRGVPQTPDIGYWHGRAPLQSFTLRKLHGSTNWFGDLSASDPLGIIQATGLIGEWAAERPRLNETEAMWAENRSPVLIPPVANKTLLYGGFSVTSHWRGAREAFRGATDLWVFGYSLPPTDSTTLALFHESLSPETVIRVIDTAPADDLIDRYTGFVQNLEFLGSVDSPESQAALDELALEFPTQA